MNQNCSYCTPINSLFADDSLFLFKPEGRYPEFGWDKKTLLLGFVGYTGKLLISVNLMYFLAPICMITSKGIWLQFYGLI